MVLVLDKAQRSPAPEAQAEFVAPVQVLLVVVDRVVDSHFPLFDFVCSASFNLGGFSEVEDNGLR